MLSPPAALTPLATLGVSLFTLLSLLNTGISYQITTVENDR